MYAGGVQAAVFGPDTNFGRAQHYVIAADYLGVMPVVCSLLFPNFGRAHHCCIAADCFGVMPVVCSLLSSASIMQSAATSALQASCHHPSAFDQIAFFSFLSLQWSSPESAVCVCVCV